MFTVTVSEKDGQQSTFNFDKPEIGIGRVKGNDIVLPKGNVSKRHSRIVVKDAKFIVIDLKSTNGTYVNGRKITSPQVIKSADKVYIGDFVLTVTGDPNSVGDQDLANASPPAGIQEMSPRPNPTPIAPPAPPIAPPAPIATAPPIISPLATPPGPSPIAPPPPSSSMINPTLPSTPAAVANIASSSGISRLATTAGPPPSGLGNRISPSRPSGLSGVPPRSGVAPARPMGPITPPQNTPKPNHMPAPAPTPAVGVKRIDPPTPRSIAPGQEMLSSLRTPGVAVIPPEPQFVSRFDQGFADAQVLLAEEFFGSVDPRELPTAYPPADEDRTQYEPSLRGIVERQGHPEMFEHLMSEIVGLGPLEAMLDDDSIEEIFVNSHDQILYRQNGQIVAAERAYSHPDFLYLTAQRLLGGRMDEPDAEPADEVRFSDGTRVHILMPPLAPRGPVLTIRKAQRELRTIEELVTDGVLSPAIAEFLGHAVAAGRSILIGGMLNTGRIEILNALGNLIPDGTRIVTIEESAALKLPQHSVVSLECGTGHQNHYDLRYLLRSSMRLHPERLLVGNLNGPEAYEWVTAAAGGTVGSMAISHGVSSRDLLGRLESLCLMGAHDLAPRGLREQIARAVHLVIVMHRHGDGSVKVQQISEVQGVDLDNLRVSDIFYYRAEQGGGSFVPTGYIPQFYESLRNAGVHADTGIFQA